MGGFRSRIQARWKTVRDALFKPVDASTLAFYRIAFGALMAIETITRCLNFAEERYAPDRFHFTYPWFGWIEPFSWPLLYTEIGLMIAAAFGIMWGLYYRLSTLVFFLGYTHLFLVEKAVYNNHYYLICLLGLLFLVSDGHADASWDNLRRPQTDRGWVPFWQVALFRTQFFIVYFFGGLAKLNPDWLAGEPMRAWLHDLRGEIAFGDILAQEWSVQMFTWGGLLFDLGIGFLLLWRRTRLLALVPLVLFHLTNAYLWTIGVFPWLAIVSTVMFFEPGTMRPLLHKAGLAWRQVQVPRQLADVRSTRVVLVLLWAYLLLQFSLPLRHHFYPDDASWTETGHLFAWRMKLRDKRSDCIFHLRDPLTGETRVVTPEDMLESMTPRQVYSMGGDPHMIWQYAQELARQAEAAGEPRPEVRAHALISLNGRPTQMLVDPEANLAAEEYPWFGVPEWVEPLDREAPLGLYEALKHE